MRIHSARYGQDLRKACTDHHGPAIYRVLAMRSVLASRYTSSYVLSSRASPQSVAHHDRICMRLVANAPGNGTVLLYSRILNSEAY